MKNDLNFKQQDIEIILSLGRVLGTSNREDQGKNFQLILNQIIILEKEAKLERDKNEKMFKSLGGLSWPCYSNNTYLEERDSMNVDLIFKIASIGILLSILHTLLDNAGKEEFAFITTLVGVVIVFGAVIGLISKLFDSIKTLFQLY